MSFNKDPLVDYFKTKHFRAREEQRAFGHAATRFLLTYADTVQDVGSGSVALSLSAAGYKSLDPELRSTREAEKARRSALVVNQQMLITAINLTERDEGRRYRMKKNENGHPYRPQKSRKHAKNQHKLNPSESF